jgi:hypothetical protein
MVASSSLVVSRAHVTENIGQFARSILEYDCRSNSLPSNSTLGKDSFKYVVQNVNSSNCLVV